MIHTNFHQVFLMNFSFPGHSSQVLYFPLKLRPYRSEGVWIYCSRWLTSLRTIMSCFHRLIHSPSPCTLAWHSPFLWSDSCNIYLTWHQQQLCTAFRHMRLGVSLRGKYHSHGILHHLKLLYLQLFSKDMYWVFRGVFLLFQSGCFLFIVN